MNTTRCILFAAAIASGLVASLHSGVLLRGWEHAKAATAESVIAAVLVLGIGATLIWPGLTRRIALGVEGFAMLGTLVGICTVAIGIGPRTVPDIVIHALLIVGLIVALLTTARTGERA
jgi:hypothetical protein